MNENDLTNGHGGDVKAPQGDEESYAKIHLQVMFHKKKQSVFPKKNYSKEFHLNSFHSIFVTSSKI